MSPVPVVVMAVEVLEAVSAEVVERAPIVERKQSAMKPSAEQHFECFAHFARSGPLVVVVVEVVPAVVLAVASHAVVVVVLETSQRVERY